MSVGILFWILSAVLFFFMAFDVIDNDIPKWTNIALGLIPTGLIFSGWIVPITFIKRE